MISLDFVRCEFCYRNRDERHVGGSGWRSVPLESLAVSLKGVVLLRSGGIVVPDRAGELFLRKAEELSDCDGVVVGVWGLRPLLGALLLSGHS